MITITAAQQITGKDFGNTGGSGPDKDSDGIVDTLDNYPTVYNPNQLDSNKNGIGDACESIPNIPEFPSIFLPATMIIGFLGAVLLIRRTREHSRFFKSNWFRIGR